MTDDDVHDAIDRWHDDGGSQEIYEFLGWTWEQYAQWVETGELP